MVPPVRQGIPRESQKDSSDDKLQLLTFPKRDKGLEAAPQHVDENVVRLKEALSSEDTSVRQKANAEINRLFDALGSPDFRTREKASAQLTELAKYVLSQAADAMQSKEPEVRRRAHDIRLAGFGVIAAEAIRDVELARRTRPVDDSRRFNRLDQSVDAELDYMRTELVDALTDPALASFRARFRNIQELVAAAEKGGDRARQLVGAALAGSDELMVKLALAAFEMLPQDHRHQLGPNLVTVIFSQRDTFRFVSQHCAKAVNDLGKAGVREIAGMLMDKSPDIRSTAAGLLATWVETKDRSAAFQELAHLAEQDEDIRVRIDAITALSGLGTKADEILCRILKDKSLEDDLRVAAATSLSNYDAAGPTLTDVMLGVLRDKENSAELRARAADALSYVGRDSKVASEALVDALNDEPAVLAEAIESLIFSTHHSERLVPKLLELMRHREANVRQAAAVAAAQIGAPQEVNESLGTFLAEATVDDAWASREIMRTLSMKKSEVAGPLMAALTCKTAGVRIEAMRFLSKLDHEAKPAIGMLIQTLNDPSAEVLTAAARTLSELAPHVGPEALMPLRGLLSRPEPEVRQAAEEALEAIEKTIGQVVHPASSFSSAAG